MRIKITGRNIELTEGLKAAVEDKLNKLEKYFTPDTEVNVTLSVEKERQKVEVTIPMKGSYIRSEQVSSDMYVSIDLVEEVIERQLKKYRTKLVTKQQNAAAVFKQETTNVNSSQYDGNKDSVDKLIRASSAQPKIVGFNQQEGGKALLQLMNGDISVEECVKLIDDDRVATLESFAQ